VNVLGTRWLYRLGGTAPRRHAGEAERPYIDFTVDGVSLEESLRSRQRDLIGVLGWGDAKWNREVVNRLSFRSQSAPSTGRYLLYGCSECGDLGCGGITAQVTQSTEGISWSQFGFENNYEPAMSDFESYREVGPFSFERAQYEAALETALIRNDV
jgi:hypothetical protein